MTAKRIQFCMEHGAVRKKPRQMGIQINEVIAQSSAVPRVRVSRTPLIKYTQSPSHLLLSNGCDTLNREARQQSAAWRLTNTEDDHNHELIMFLQLISRSKAASILQEFYLKASDPSVVRRLKKKKISEENVFRFAPSDGSLSAVYRGPWIVTVVHGLGQSIS
ncbi:hypothetical protein RRG08_064646 [Elysia crispata]|uniref:Uncharacterized protein n=1 Tax=Elysia crispata TaxID=231223 RepID=A0AAE1B9M2_9GAST|nr:hypothetical protein RRG08_064646 [Elysia crispata]